METIIEYINWVQTEYSETISYIQEMFGDNQFFQATMVTGAIVGIAKLVWTYIISFPVYVWKRFIKRRILYKLTCEENGDNIYKFFEDHIHEQIGVDARRNMILKARSNRQVDIENKQDIVMHWYKCGWYYWPIFITKDRIKLEAARDKANLHQEFYKIESWFIRKPLLLIHKRVSQKYEENLRTKKERKVYKADGSYGSHVIKRLQHCKDLDGIFFKNKTKLVSSIERFLSKEQFYLNKGIPYKKNVLLNGPPGSGKTITYQAIAKHFNKDVYVVNIDKNMSEDYLVDIVSNIPEKSIIVYEDLDRIFKEKSSTLGIRKEFKINIKVLLNILSGVYTPHGSITFITCNEPERLPQVFTRDGRIDLNFTIGHAGTVEIEEFIKFFYDVEELPIPIRKDIKVPMSSIEKVVINNISNIDKAITEVNDNL